METMDYIKRDLEQHLNKALRRGKSVLLLEPRQTGKSTLLSFQQPRLFLSFIKPEVRLRYEKSPELLAKEIENFKQKKPPLVILDEVQKIPDLMDVVQDCVDRRLAQFILTGSSARK